MQGQSYRRVLLVQTTPLHTHSLTFSEFHAKGQNVTQTYEKRITMTF